MPPKAGKVQRSGKDRDRLVQQWIGLPLHIAMKYRHRREVEEIGVDDAAAYGMLGLLRAAELWDETRGVKFNTYAYRSVEQFMLRECRQHAFGIRVPEHRWRDGHFPPERVLDDWMDNPDPPAAPEENWSAWDSAEMQELVGKLHPRQRTILRLVFFEGWNLKQAGQVLGVCRERARQIKEEALAELRKRLHVAV